MKNTLIICSHSPYGSVFSKEALDAVLAASVFIKSLSVLFIDEGVYQLVKEQNSQTTDSKISRHS